METLCGVSPTHSDHGEEHVLCGTIQRSTVSAESVRATRVANRRGWNGSVVVHGTECPRIDLSCTLPRRQQTIPMRRSQIAHFQTVRRAENHHPAHQCEAQPLESTSTSPCTTSTSTSHCLSSSGSDLKPMRRYLKPFVEVVRWSLHRRRARGCAYECYRLGIYDRPPLCATMENTRLTGVQRVLQQ
jgi:hypothetical protein